MNLQELERECQKNSALCGKLAQAQEGATDATNYKNNALVLIHGVQKDKNMTRFVQLVLQGLEDLAGKGLM